MTNGLDFGYAYIMKSSQGIAIERGEWDEVKVDESEMRYTDSREHMSRMTSNSSQAYHHDEFVLNQGEPTLSEEGDGPGVQLLSDLQRGVRGEGAFLRGEEGRRRWCFGDGWFLTTMVVEVEHCADSDHQPTAEAQPRIHAAGRKEGAMMGYEC